MGEVLIKAVSFVAIIALGHGLKRRGFFKPSDFYLLSSIVVKITLPAAIIHNFSNITMEPSLLFMVILGIGCNLFTIGAGYLIYLRRSNKERAFAMINLSGYNIGNFTLPFVQSFLSSTGFAATSLFDTGNAIMCTGITNSFAGVVIGGESRSSVRQVLKKLVSSIPFDAYIIMTLLTLFQIPLPEVVLSFAKTAGSANAFIALLMLGIGFEIRMEKSKLLNVIKILSWRYGLAVVMALSFYFFTPFSLELRTTLVILCLGPIASVAPAYTGEIGGDIEMASAINSLSILISITAITITLLVIL